MSTFGIRNSRIQTPKAAPKATAPAKAPSIPGMEQEELRAMLQAVSPETGRRSIPTWYRLLVLALSPPLMFAMLNPNFAHTLGMTTSSAQHTLILFTFINLAILKASQKPTGEQAETAVRGFASLLLNGLLICAIVPITIATATCLMPGAPSSKSLLLPG